MPGYPVPAIGSLVWFLPLVLQRRKSVAPQKVDRRARWGVLLVGAGYTIPWQTAFWARPSGGWRVVVSAVCFVAASAFSWTAARALGRHWRIEAGLDADHQLVQSGVYGLVRHPIYTSKLFVVAGTKTRLLIKSCPKHLEERGCGRGRSEAKRKIGPEPALRRGQPQGQLGSPHLHRHPAIGLDCGPMRAPSVPVIAPPTRP